MLRSLVLFAGRVPVPPCTRSASRCPRARVPLPGVRCPCAQVDLGFQLIKTAVQGIMTRVRNAMTIRKAHLEATIEAEERVRQLELAQLVSLPYQKQVCGGAPGPTFVPCQYFRGVEHNKTDNLIMIIRGRTVRCARAVRKVGHSPPPVGSFLGVGLPQGTIAVVCPCSINPPPSCMYVPLQTGTLRPVYGDTFSGCLLRGIIFCSHFSDPLLHSPWTLMLEIGCSTLAPMGWIILRTRHV